MTMKNVIRQDTTNKDEAERYFAWRLFVIRYLILDRDEFDIEFIRYRKNEEERLSRINNNIFTLLDYFLRLCKEYKITILKAGFSDYSPLPEKKSREILDELDESKDKLLNKIPKHELSANDIKKLLDMPFKYKNEVLNNLSFEIKYAVDSAERLKKLLGYFVKYYIEGKFDETEFFETPQSYTYLYQKSNFLKYLPELIRQHGYSLRFSEQRDASIFGEDTQRVRFLEVLLALEYEGYFEITQLDTLSPQKYKLKEPSKQDIVLDIKLNDKAIPTRERLASYQATGVVTPPAGWSLVIEEAKAHITKDGHILFTFPSNTSNQFRYFKCLWNNYGKRVTYHEVYEFESNLKHPNEKGKNWKFNDLIRNSIRKLKKQFANKNIPIQMEVNKGFTLTIKTS